RHIDRAEAAAARFGAGAAFDDAERMLDAVALDGVVVVVPPDQFSSVVRACIRRGVPVFAEKPAANDAAEAADLAAEAAESGVQRGKGTEHTVAARATAESGAVVNIRANTTGSWEQHNEAVEIFGEGHSLFVDNIDTCTWRPPARPEHTWRPNYTVPVALNMTSATMGFGSELEHFRRVVTEGIPNESDIASAAA